MGLRCLYVDWNASDCIIDRLTCRLDECLDVVQSFQLFLLLLLLLLLLVQLLCCCGCCCCCGCGWLDRRIAHFKNNECHKMVFVHLGFVPNVLSFKFSITTFVALKLEVALHLKQKDSSSHFSRRQ